MAFALRARCGACYTVVVRGFAFVLLLAGGVASADEALEPGTVAPLRLRRDGAEVIVQVERAKRGYLGVSPQDPGDEKRKALGLAPEDGLLLASVAPDGPAAKGGLRAGDVVITMAGVAINERNLSSTLARLGAGEKVTVVVGRDGQRVTLTFTLGTPPERP